MGRTTTIVLVQTRRPEIAKYDHSHKETNKKEKKKTPAARRVVEPLKNAQTNGNPVKRSAPKLEGLTTTPPAALPRKIKKKCPQEPPASAEKAYRTSRYVTRNVAGTVCGGQATNVLFRYWASDLTK